MFHSSPETAYPIETDVALSSTTSKSLDVTTPTARTTIATTSDPTSLETATEIVTPTTKPEAAGVSSKVVMRMLGHQDDEARANGKSRTYRYVLYHVEYCLNYVLNFLLQFNE